MQDLHDDYLKQVINIPAPHVRGCWSVRRRKLTYITDTALPDAILISVSYGFKGSLQSLEMMALGLGVFFLYMQL